MKVGIIMKNADPRAANSKAKSTSLASHARRKSVFVSNNRSSERNRVPRVDFTNLDQTAAQGFLDLPTQSPEFIKKKSAPLPQ